MGKLNALSVQRATSKGLLGDGNGLYLQISASGSKSWIFRYMNNGKARSMGLGSVELVSLAEARSKAFEAKRKVLNGSDPISLRESERRAQVRLAEHSFAKCAEAYINAHSPAWKNAKHIQQWRNTLKTYADPIIGNLPIERVDTAAVMQVLAPIWLSKTETASRLRGRIERILGWASVQGYRSTENPARWGGHLDNLLPKKGSVQKTEHFKALPVPDVASFICELRSRDDISARALEFTILTVTRTNETLKAKWTEFDFDSEIWIIPANRMKNKKEHRVPLTKRMIEILKSQKSSDAGEFVFTSSRSDGSLSNMSLLMMIRRMGYEVTTHGFRSTFSDWAAEKTTFPREVVEMALAHSIKNKVEAAYRRGDMLLKRRALMRDWEHFCGAPKESATVTTLEPKVQQMTK